MRNSLPVAALVVALSFTVSSSYGYGLRQLLFGPAAGCGCGCDPGCACEPGCACVYEAGCACEPCCAFEPACGCAAPCGVDGRQFAGQKWECCHEGGPPMCGCVGPGGACCNGGCGVEPACGCYEPDCGCYEPACGCEPCGCGPRRGGIGGWFGRTFGGLFKRSCGCTGCSSELYWCEWHNDPPLCHDPCDCHGNWIGPSAAGYRAPYDHPYGPAGPVGEVIPPPYVGQRTTSPPVTRTSVPATPPQVVRKPYPPAHRTYQR